MDVSVVARDGVQDVEGSDHVVGLGVHRVLLIHHRIRSGTLFGIVDDGVRIEVTHHFLRELGVAEVAHVLTQVLAGQLAPAGHPLGQRLDRNQAVHTQLDIPLATHEAVGDADFVAGGR